MIKASASCNKKVGIEGTTEEKESQHRVHRAKRILLMWSAVTSQPLFSAATCRGIGSSVKALPVKAAPGRRIPN